MFALIIEGIEKAFHASTYQCYDPVLCGTATKLCSKICLCSTVTYPHLQNKEIRASKCPIIAGIDKQTPSHAVR